MSFLYIVSSLRMATTKREVKGGGDMNNSRSSYSLTGRMAKEGKKFVTFKVRLLGIRRIKCQTIYFIDS